MHNKPACENAAKMPSIEPDQVIPVDHQLPPTAESRLLEQQNIRFLGPVSRARHSSFLKRGEKEHGTPSVALGLSALTVRAKLPAPESGKTSWIEKCGGYG